MEVLPSPNTSQAKPKRGMMLFMSLAQPMRDGTPGSPWKVRPTGAFKRLPVHPGEVVRGAEIVEPAANLLPRDTRLPSHSERESYPPGDAVRVLRVEAEKNSVKVLRLSRALREGPHLSQQKAGKREIRHVGSKAEVPVGRDIIHQVETASVGADSKLQVVAGARPTEVVGPGEALPDESGEGSFGKTEETRDADALHCFGSGLIDVLHAEIGYVRRSGAGPREDFRRQKVKRASLSRLERKMCISVQQEVLRGDLRASAERLSTFAGS